MNDFDPGTAKEEPMTQKQVIPDTEIMYGILHMKNYTSEEIGKGQNELLLKFNIIHSGTNDKNFCIALGSHWSEQKEQESYLNVSVNLKITVSHRYNTIIKKPNVLFGYIRKHMGVLIAKLLGGVVHNTVSESHHL